jgi:hypothetical protein
VVKWVKEWLNNKTQQAVINSGCSSETSVDSVVPRGIVLGPCLFTTFLNNLEMEVEVTDLRTFIKKFTDNTKRLQVIESEVDRDKIQRVGG